jgi:hypothetical protein
MPVNPKHALTQPRIRIRRRDLHRRPICEHERRVDIVLRLLPHRLDERKLRQRERRRDPGLLKSDHAVSGADYPRVTNPVRQSHTRTEIAALQFPRRVRKVEHLRLEVENRVMVVDLS